MSDIDICMAEECEIVTPQGASASTDLLCRVDSIFKEVKRPLSASDVARELHKRGWMPDMWSTLDVADFLRDWYGS